MNHSPLRSGPNAIELLEDPIPLRDVRVALDADAEIARVYEARAGTELPLERIGGRWVTTVPSAAIVAMVVFEEAR